MSTGGWTICVRTAGSQTKKRQRNQKPLFSTSKRERRTDGGDHVTVDAYLKQKGKQSPRRCRLRWSECTCICPRRWLGRRLSTMNHPPEFERGQREPARSCLRGAIEIRDSFICVLVYSFFFSPARLFALLITVEDPCDVRGGSSSRLAAKCLVTAVTDRPVFRWRFHYRCRRFT